MKKAVKLLLSAALLSGLSACSAERGTLKTVQRSGKIIIGLEGNWQPWSYHDESDTLVGYDVEVGKAIAEKLGVEAEFIEGPWDGLFAGIDSGRYDIIINGVGVTEERQKSYSFSDPYAYDSSVLIVLEGNEDVKTFEDLAGKKTANSIGSTYMELGEACGATVEGVDSLTETLDMVKQGRVDATINARTSFYDYMKYNPDDPFVITDESEDLTSIAIPMRGNDSSKELKEAINEAIRQLREEGKLTELSVKYFGSDISVK
ncbi:MAG: transporter substrate-binding domain-containing protein [Solobacterium sp.]|nr:transporter substrate-binding domain-containing protein [Solobacterium sp.]